MTDDFESWWELNGCREFYATQKDAARAAWERAQQKYSHAYFTKPASIPNWLPEDFDTEVEI